MPAEEKEAGGAKESGRGRISRRRELTDVNDFTENRGRNGNAPDGTTHPTGAPDVRGFDGSGPGTFPTAPRSRGSGPAARSHRRRPLCPPGRGLPRDLGVL